jgi:thiol-disulfide isomerase/thioredoxin
VIFVAAAIAACAGSSRTPPALTAAASSASFPALGFVVTPAAKIAVIDVWASWCKPCAKAFPLLNDLARAHPDVAVVGISLDDDDAAVERFLAATPANFTIVRDRDKLLHRAPLAIAQIPTLLLVDGRGRIRWRVDNAQLSDYAALPALVAELTREP